MKNKAQLRQYAKKLRKTLNISEASTILVNKIRENDLYINAKNVMIYYPFGEEINLLKLLDDDKNFYLPRVNCLDLEVCPYNFGDLLRKSKYGISEPVSASINPQTLDLAIVPALMVSKEGYRLGYGGGFYDRFLDKNPDIATITPIFKELTVDSLPVDNFDKRINCIIHT